MAAASARISGRGGSGGGAEQTSGVVEADAAAENPPSYGDATAGRAAPEVRDEKGVARTAEARSMDAKDEAGFDGKRSSPRRAPAGDEHMC